MVRVSLLCLSSKSTVKGWRLQLGAYKLLLIGSSPSDNSPRHRAFWNAQATLNQPKMIKSMIAETFLYNTFKNSTIWISKYYLQFFQIIGSNFMTSWLKGDFTLKSYFRKNNFGPKSGIEISNKLVLRECFEYNLQKKKSILNISWAKIFILGVKLQNILFRY